MSTTTSTTVAGGKRRSTEASGGGVRDAASLDKRSANEVDLMRQVTEVAGARNGSPFTLTTSLHEFGRLIRTLNHLFEVVLFKIGVVEGKPCMMLRVVHDSQACAVAIDWQADTLLHAREEDQPLISVRASLLLKISGIQMQHAPLIITYEAEEKRLVVLMSSQQSSMKIYIPTVECELKELQNVGAAMEQVTHRLTVPVVQLKSLLNFVSSRGEKSLSIGLFRTQETNQYHLGLFGRDHLSPADASHMIINLNSVKADGDSVHSIHWDDSEENLSSTTEQLLDFDIFAKEQIIEPKAFSTELLKKFLSSLMISEPTIDICLSADGDLLVLVYTFTTFVLASFDEDEDGV